MMILGLLVVQAGAQSAATGGVTKAGSTATNTPASGAPANDLVQTEWLKSYLQLKEELHQAQLAMMNHRLAAETTANTQAAALAEKMDAIRQTLETERARQQQDVQTSNRTVLWAAAGFGLIGLLAVLLAPLLQWRAFHRLAEEIRARPALPPAGSSPAPLALAGAGLDDLAHQDRTVALSNQRLLAMIDRMERRIIELEQTGRSPLPAPALASGSQSSDTRAAEPAASAPPVAAASSAAGAATVAPVNGLHGSATTPAESSSSNLSATFRAAARAAVAASASPSSPSLATPTPPRVPLSGPEGQVALLLGKGRVLLTANQVQDALACYDEILKINARHAEALLRKGSALERLKRDDEAIRYYDRAIASDRQMTLAYLYKGGVCNRLGRYDEALECYEQALQTEEGKK